MEQTELVVASIFCSSGIGMVGHTMAGLTPVYAADIAKEPLEIFDANYKYTDGSSVVHQADARQLKGVDIVAAVKAITGSETIHFMDLGPSCQDYIRLNSKRKQGGGQRRNLMLDAIRLIYEAQPLVAMIEEAPEFLLDENKDISVPYFKLAKKMNYNNAYMVMNSTHYGSNQSRTRFIHLFVRKDLNKNPVFPEPMLGKEKRVKDFLDIDYFFSGHFSDKIKTKNHFMCTVTSDSPKWFAKGDRQWEPTMEERMLCMDIDPAKYKLASTKTAQKQAFGNGIPAMLTYHISKTLIEKVLCMERDPVSGLWSPKK